MVCICSRRGTPSPRCWPICLAHVDDEFYNSVTDAGWNTYCRDADTGAIYAFPETTQVQGWLVNEEIFSKCGLEVPETTKQLLAAIPALKEKGYIPIAFGTKEPWFSWGWEHLPSLWGYWEQADDLFTKGTPKCEDADFVNVYNYIADPARRARSRVQRHHDVGPGPGTLQRRAGRHHHVAIRSRLRAPWRGHRQ